MLSVFLKNCRNLRATLLIGLCMVGLSGAGCGDASSPPKNLVGSWGGTNQADSRDPATLRVTASNGILTYACGDYAQSDQPLQPNTNGHFSVLGTYHPKLNPSTLNIRMEGVISGSSMTLTVQPGSGGVTPSTYLLNYGRQAPPLQSGCPS